MLKTTQAISRSRKAAADFDVEIAGVGTALPAYILPQAEATEHARALFPHLGRLEALYGKTARVIHASRANGITHRMTGWTGRKSFSATRWISSKR